MARKSSYKFTKFPTKQKMTFVELSEFFVKHYDIVPNKRVIGEYAKQAGYKRHTQMINRKFHNFYINERIK